MDVKVFVPAIVGACFGALGWLCVGLYMARRAAARQAKNAGRAVYFELSMNRLAVRMASEYDAFSDLSRSAFDRLLPELATWLEPAELQTVVSAYAGHVGYEQLRSDPSVPAPLRRQALTGILGAQERAIGLVGARVFTPEELRSIETAEPDSVGAPADVTRTSR
ncbi:MAG TPA: hypothetical protein VNN79_06685 [Actinomycetota bacterium]|nr:hypothetical protein [Actinomycetota bacterium]